jgi:hypothetical protein
MHHYAYAHKTIRYVFRDRNKAKKIETSLQLFAENPLISLVEHIERAYTDISKYIQEQPDTFAEHQDTLMSQLDYYRETVLHNVSFFSSRLQSLA